MFTSKILPYGQNGDGSMIDISPYVLDYEWSGDISQGGRKLAFKLAYNSKDKVFVNVQANGGDTVYLYYQTDLHAVGPLEPPKEIFRGKIFYKNRDTSTNSYEFTAYDDLYIWAHSEIRRKFSDIPAESVVEQVAGLMGTQVGKICEIGVNVDFIADPMTATETVQKAFEIAGWTTQKKYHIYMQEGMLYVVERSQEVEGYVATDMENVEHTQHSESAEEMVNTVQIVNAEGTEVGRVSNDEDIKRYGTMQKVYKEDPKQDTQTAAKALLKSIVSKSSLDGLGDVRCIAGYAIIVQEEQLKGKFAIISDRHTIAGKLHKMSLDLQFLQVTEGAAT